MLALVVTAFVYTALAVAAGLQVGWMVATPDQVDVRTLLLFGGTVLALWAVRYQERVLAERLGQHYVRQLRGGLVRHALSGSRAPSLGITVARTTNDLSSVRNWVAQGITPLVSAIPLVLGSVAALAVIDWRLAIAVGGPVVVLALLLVGLSGAALERATLLRRQRGRMAARISDTVHAAQGIVAGGGVDRELRRLDADSRRVTTAAVDRAKVAGLLRGAAMAAPLLASGTLAAAAAVGGVDPARLATALTIVGVLGAPLGDLGRVVEYRQNYLAARRIIAPLLASVATQRSPEQPAGDWRAAPGTGLTVRGLVVHGEPVADLAAPPWSRVLLRSTRPERKRAVLAELVTGGDGAVGCLVDGIPLGLADASTRRGLVGMAYAGAWFERGQIGRAVRYRVPDADDPAVYRALADVGLRSRVAALPDGLRTELRRGGEPLNRWERAQLQLARATIGNPPVLVLSDIDSDLDRAGVNQLNSLLARYPGTVVCSTPDPERLAADWTRWDLDEPVHGRG
ncbi:ABC transporter transmembrane domain-containing protein [Microlunatus sp. Y2014]|uniref:ABC transporter transmembrane domain-containing protein n=1 Tax=Microlunatus sp. Y2014 TaxID=3418488 RepID=UPI003DA73838